MTIPKNLDRIHYLPDYAVLTKKQVEALTGLSAATLTHMARKGSGPPRVRLSTYRVGYPLGGFREWLKRHELAKSLPGRRPTGAAA
jgi:predicted DNA-binding transcriptional regulator AlpA